MFSATAMAASLPDCTMMPLISSSTFALVPTGTNIAEVPDGAPPLRQAFSLIRYSSVSLTSPALSALNTTASSISLLMLAGGMSSSASRWNMMAPVSASIRIACGDLTTTSPLD